MSWCLECHRAPETSLRPRELVTDLGWETDEDRFELGSRLMDENHIRPRQDCTTCHR